MDSLNLSNFDTAKVTNMKSMFSGCSQILSLDLEKFNTSNVINMEFMFENCFLMSSLILSSFDTSKTIYIESIFSHCSSLTELDISNFNFTSVISMAYLFSSCKILNSLLLPNLTNLNVINLSHMFSDCESLTSLDLSQFDTSNVIYMDNMFSGCKLLTYLNVENFNTEFVIDMKYMFQGCEYLTSLNLSFFDTNSVKSMIGMFYGCSSLKELDISNFNASSVENIAFMFYKTKSITSLDISNFNTTNVEQMIFMFDDCESLISLDLSHFNTTKIELLDGMFSGCSSLKYLNIINFDTSKVTSMCNMFKGCKSLTTLDLSSFDTTLVTSFEYLFSGCNSLTELNIDNFSTSSVIYMQYLFSDCSSIKSLDLSHFNTSLVINMENMFNSCSNLISINLDSFDTSFVTNMKNMFFNCFSLVKVEINNLNTSSVLNMAHMFENCYSLTSINLSNFVVNKVETMENMFANDKKLVYVNFYKADDSKIKTMNNIFLGSLENMVFCINELYGRKLNGIIRRKGCSAIDCTRNWNNSRKLIIASTNKCVDKCPESTIFFYDFKCHYRCPNETLPENYVCKDPEPGKDNFTDINPKDCSIRKYFLHMCKKIFYNNREKIKFIDDIINDMLNGNLYDLAMRAIENNEIFIIDEGTEVYSISALSNKNRHPNLTFIEMDECANILRENNELLKNDLILFKIEYKIPEFKIPIIEYTLFAIFGTQKISLKQCKNLKVHLYIPKIINDYKEYKYNPKNEYFYDKCLSFSDENKTDLTLNDRIYEFNSNNNSLCESICTFKRYVFNNIECKCDIKLKFNSFLNEVSKLNLLYRFQIPKNESSNLWVLKCFFNILSIDVIIYNYFSQILLGIIFLNILIMIIFYAKESEIFYKKIKIAIQLISENEKQLKNNLNKNNNIKYENNFINKKSKLKIFPKKKYRVDNSQSKNGSDIKALKGITSKNSFSLGIKENKGIISNLSKVKHSNMILKNEMIKSEYLEIGEKTYNELNSLSYTEAIISDKRTLCEYYYSFLMTKELILFTFSSKNDFNSKSIKICFLLNIFALFLFINTSFIDDSVLHVLYMAKGKVSIFYFLPTIIYITIIASFIKNFLILFVFTESNFISLRENDDTYKKEYIRQMYSIVSIKCFLFFIFSIFIMICVWIYLACFFTIFKNTQILVLKNTFISFGISLLIPIVFGVFPAVLRIFSLSNRESQNRLGIYYISKILQVII